MFMSLYGTDVVHAHKSQIQSQFIAAARFKLTCFKAGRPVSKWVNQLRSGSVAVNQDVTCTLDFWCVIYTYPDLTWCCECLMVLHSC